MNKYLFAFGISIFYVVNVFASTPQSISCPTTFPNYAIDGAMPAHTAGYYQVFLNYSGSANEVVVAKADNETDAIARAKEIITSGLTPTTKNAQMGPDASYCIYASSAYQLCTSVSQVDSGSCEAAFVGYLF